MKTAKIALAALTTAAFILPHAGAQEVAPDVEFPRPSNLACDEDVSTWRKEPPRLPWNSSPQGTCSEPWVSGNRLRQAS